MSDQIYGDPCHIRAERAGYYSHDGDWYPTSAVEPTSYIGHVLERILPLTWKCSYCQCDFGEGFLKENRAAEDEEELLSWQIVEVLRQCGPLSDRDLARICEVSILDVRKSFAWNPAQVPIGNTGRAAIRQGNQWRLTNTG